MTKEKFKRILAIPLPSHDANKKKKGIRRCKGIDRKEIVNDTLG